MNPGMSLTFAEDSILGVPYVPLPEAVTAAATRYVTEHGGADLLAMLGLDGGAL